MSDALTIRKNLSSLSEGQRYANIVTKAEIAEAARCLIGKKPSECAEFFKKAFQKSPLCPEMLTLCISLSKDSPETKVFSKKGIRVALMNNKPAYSALQEMVSVSDIRILTVSDFRSACEEVSLEGADACILPMCSSSDGYYPTFSKLLKQYDLRINKTARVIKSDGDEEIQFALLSRDALPAPDADRIMFSYTENENTPLPLLLYTLSSCGAAPYSITSAPLPYNMDKYEHRIEALLGSLNAEALIFFLEAALTGYTLLGIYR